MKTAHDIINNLIRTEKGSGMLADNKYLFRVSPSANKIQIKMAVEEIYKVKVGSVNVMNVRGKKKRVRYREGMTAAWKKAVVTLKPDNSIEVT